MDVVNLVAWSCAGLECLGEVSEDEADAIVGEEQVRGELGACGPLLLPLLLVGPVVLLRGVALRPGLGAGVKGGGGGEAGGFAGVGGWVGGAGG